MYAIHHTRKGDYIVRDTMNRDCGRFDTETEATALRNRLDAEHAAEGARMAAEVATARAFSSANPALVERQLAWQDWRSKQFQRLCYERHGVAQAYKQAAAIAERAVIRPLERSAEATRYADMAQTRLDVTEARYDALCALDTATKNAIRSRDATAWAAALDACEAAIAGRLLTETGASAT